MRPQTIFFVTVLIAAGLCVWIVFFPLAQPKASRATPEWPDDSPDPRNKSAASFDTAPPEDSLPEERTGVNGQRTAAARDDVWPGGANEVIEEITIHVGKDFERGEFSNVLFQGTLRMGDDPSFVPRGAPSGQRFGVFISPEEEANQLFDQVVVSPEATIPEGSELSMEIRTRTAGGDWSVWRRMKSDRMSAAIGIGAPADAWQYRLTFYSNDPANGPEVASVAIATRPVAAREDLLSAGSAGAARRLHRPK